MKPNGVNKKNDSLTQKGFPLNRDSQILSDMHWKTERFRQRLATVQWRQILLEWKEHIIVKGHVRRLVAKSLGAGVVEVFKEPL